MMHMQTTTLPMSQLSYKSVKWHCNVMVYIFGCRKIKEWKQKTHFLQFVRRYFNPSSWSPSDMVKLITSISAFLDSAKSTLSSTGTNSMLNFLIRSHLLNNSAKVSLEISAMLKSRYKSRDLKSGWLALT